MATERRESEIELKGSQSSQNSEHLLANFLSKGDFQNAFAMDKKEALPSQFPSGLEIFGDGDKADHIEAKRPRVADRGDDSQPKAENKQGIVEKNANGEVTKVTYPDGKTKEFEYDAKHHLSKIKYQNGDYYERDPKTGVWDLHSKHTTDSLGRAGIRVEKNGNLIVTSQDDSLTMVTRPDGKVGRLERVNGQVTKIDYPGNDNKKLEYDQNGELSKVTEKDGTYWTKQADGTWKGFDQKDKPTGRNLGKIEIEITGELTQTSVDGKNEKILLIDGTIYEKENGRVSRIIKR